MSTLTVVFSRSRKPISWLIRFFTWSKWSHCGVLCPDGDYVYESKGDLGVVKTPIETFKSRHHEWVFAQVPCKDRKIAFRRLKMHLGKEYDMTAIYGYVLRRDWQNTDKWFCSEYVADAMQVFRKGYSKRITPEDLWRISED